MKINNEANMIDIIYPTNMNTSSPTSLLICEGFIDRLINSSISSYEIKINTELKLVECNDSVIKNYLDLIMKSKKLNCFYEQFISLLHKEYKGLDNSWRLICYFESQKIQFYITEFSSLPDFSWKIQKIIK